ncbi:ribosomal protein S5 domain 2-type protein [Gaertneriomyces semiglobifer]|nr:ribosomal protein S5 domain 2-type protein [Gaertneriomyces semiglobifer]
MVKETEPSNNEKAFVLEALREGLRVDGRGPHDMRTVAITLGPQYGHAEVRLGKTRATANISAEIVRPRANAPNEGHLIFQTDFSPMASPAFDDTRITDEEVHISRLLERALRMSHAVDTEGLCIMAGEKVWQLRVDLRILDHEGNIADCACMAAIAGLLHYKRPDVTLSGEDVIVHTSEERNPIPLGIHHIPVCVTFGFFEDGERQVVDPTLLEEHVQSGDLTFVVNKHREVCTLTKAGGVAITVDQVLSCANIAAAKAAEITELIKDAITKSQKDQPTLLVETPNVVPPPPMA